MSKLFIVGTPIGNLDDITIRALDTLRNVDFVYSEDTRVTKKMLARYEIDTQIKSFHEHSKDSVYKKILAELEDGKNIALVTDAGTPGICDPGGRLVEYIRVNSSDVDIIPIPGVSALTALISVSGKKTQEFTFLGFPPHKKGRETFFRLISDIETRPVIFFESTHRLAKALKSLSDNLGEEYNVVIGKELTKMHETVFEGKIIEALAYFQGEKTKGEFIILVP